MALGSTQALTKMSAMKISLGSEGGRGTGLTTLPPSRADCLEIWEPQPPETSRVCNFYPLKVIFLNAKLLNVQLENVTKRTFYF